MLKDEVIGPLLKPLHITHKTSKNAVIFLARFNFFSQLQQFCQQLLLYMGNDFKTTFFTKIVADSCVVCKSLYLHIWFVYALHVLGCNMAEYESCIEFIKIQAWQWHNFSAVFVREVLTFVYASRQTITTVSVIFSLTYRLQTCYWWWWLCIW